MKRETRNKILARLWLIHCIVLAIVSGMLLIGIQSLEQIYDTNKITELERVNQAMEKTTQVRLTDYIPNYPLIKWLAEQSNWLKIILGISVIVFLSLTILTIIQNRKQKQTK